MVNEQKLNSQAVDPYLSTLLNQNNIQLIPYTEYNGEWTLPDQILREAYQRSVIDGTLNVVFRSGITLDDFIKFMKSPDNYPVFAFQDEMVCFAWLNKMSSVHAFSHFNIFKSAWGQTSHQIGINILNYWFYVFNFLETLVGLIPEQNRKAIKFAKSFGYVELGTIPKLLHEKENGTILYLTRELWAK